MQIISMHRSILCTYIHTRTHRPRGGLMQYAPVAVVYIIIINIIIIMNTSDLYFAV